MPPTAQVKNERLYRLFYLIAQKVDQESQTKKKIIEEICDTLDVSKHHFYKIHNCRIDQEGYLSVNQLLKLSEYFGCSIDELINKELHSSSIPGTPVSVCASGDSSFSKKP